MLKSEFKQSRPFWRSRSPNALFFGQLHDKDICHGISGETSPPKTTDLARSAATQKWVGYAISELFLLFEMESTSKGVIDHRIIDLRSVIFGIFTFKNIWTLSSKVLGSWSWNTFLATAILARSIVDFYSSNTMASEQVLSGVDFWVRKSVKSRAFLLRRRRECAPALRAIFHAQNSNFYS